MRKLVLLFSLCLTAGLAQAQNPGVIINSPGTLSQTILEIGLGAGFGAQLDAAFTPITADVTVVYDSQAVAPFTPSMGCNVVSNGADVTGKIAMVDRGQCSFVAKSLNAQNAGAIGVIICNNSASPAVVPMGGTDATITVPVVMLSQANCNLIKAELLNGPVNVTFDGSVQFADDLAGAQGNAVTPYYSMIPASQITGPTDYPLFAGVFAENVGTTDVNGATATLNIDHNGSNVYSETATTPGAILTGGDYEWIGLPQFDFSTNGAGTYDLEYVTTHAVADQFAGNDTLRTTTIVTDSIFCNVALDANNNPNMGSGLRIGGTATETEWGSLFYVRNGAGKFLDKVTFGVATDGTTLNGKYSLINVYTWTDANSDRVMNGTEMATSAYGEITFDATHQEFTPIQVDIVDAATFNDFALTDNSYYFVTVKVQHADSLFIGCDDAINHFQTEDITDSLNAPIVCRGGRLFGGGNWNTVFTDDWNVPSLALHIFDPATVGVQTINSNISFDVYPNPAVDQVSVRFNLAKAADYAQAEITDASGRIVQTMRWEGVQNDVFTVNTSSLPAGNYTLKVTTPVGVNTQKLTIAR